MFNLESRSLAVESFKDLKLTGNSDVKVDEELDISVNNGQNKRVRGIDI